MSRYIGPAAVLVTLMLIVTIGGCGGGTASDPAAVDTTSVLQGTVYSSGVQPAQAGQAPAAQPLFFASVTVRRTSNNAYVTDTMTDRTGKYNFPELPRGLDVTLTCTAPSGEILMTRTRLNARNCTADIDEDTTLATRCVMLMRQAADGEVNYAAENTAWQACMQFQQANRYQYGGLNGARPDFCNQEAIEQAAQALLDAATGAESRDLRLTPTAPRRCRSPLPFALSPRLLQVSKSRRRTSQ